MANVVKGLIVLSGLGFLLAIVVAVVTGSIFGITAEGFSRACTNLALIAIALAVIPKEKPPA